MVSTERRRKQESLLCRNNSSEEQLACFRSLEEANELTEANMNLVRHTISIYYPGLSTSDEDAFQEGLIGLILASRHYDNSIGAFSSFAIKCIRNQLNQYLNKLSKCYSLEDTYTSIDDSEDENFLNSEIFCSSEDVDYYNVLKKDFMSCLSESQSVIVKLAIEGRSQSDIARKIGYSKQYVSKQMKLIRAKFDTYMYSKAS